MTIDFRVRPPFRSFTSMRIYGTQVTAMPQRVGLQPAPSALERSMELFLTEMQEAGISHGILWGRMMPAVHGEVANEDIAALVAEYPQRFTGLGVVDLTRYEDLRRQVDHAVSDLHLRGIVVEPGFQAPAAHVDDRRLYPVYERCQELGVPVMLTMSAFVGPDLSYSNPTHLDQVAGDFPKLSLIVSHACWPWVLELCGVAIKRENVYILPDAFGFSMPGYLHYVEAANTYLADRMLFGSAYPILPLKPTVEAYGKLPYRDDVREKVMHENARRLLGLSL